MSLSKSQLSRKFLRACRIGENLHEIKECIEAGVDVNVQDSFGRTAAMFALIGQTQNIFQFLTERNDIDWNIQNDWGDTVALIAAKLRRYNFLKMLLQNQAENIDWNIQNKEGRTVAMYVCEWATDGNIESNKCLKMLSEIKTVDWNIKNNFGFTAAMIAVWKKNMEAVRILCQIEDLDWNVQDKWGNTAVMFAAKLAGYEILKMLMQKREIDWDLTINDRGDSALDLLVRNEQYEKIVKEIKSSVSEMIRKSDDREVTKTPLIFALENDLEEIIIKILIVAAKAQDIVDLVLYSRSFLPSSVASLELDCENPRKKIKLNH